MSEKQHNKTGYTPERKKQKDESDDLSSEDVDMDESDDEVVAAVPSQVAKVKLKPKIPIGKPVLCLKANCKGCGTRTRDAPHTPPAALAAAIAASAGSVSRQGESGAVTNRPPHVPYPPMYHPYCQPYPPYPYPPYAPMGPPYPPYNGSAAPYIAHPHPYYNAPMGTNHSHQHSYAQVANVNPRYQAQNSMRGSNSHAYAASNTRRPRPTNQPPLQRDEARRQTRQPDAPAQRRIYDEAIAWKTVQKFPIDFASAETRQDAINNAREEVQKYLRRQGPNPLTDLWKGYKSGFSSDDDGSFSQKYQCVYKDVGACNCHYKEEYEASSSTIHLQWYSGGSAHGITSAPTFKDHEEHASFQHVRANEEDKVKTTPSLEMLEHVDKIAYDDPSIKPKACKKKLQKAEREDGSLRHVLSDQQWVSLKIPIYNHLKSAKNRVKKRKGEVAADTVADIYSWVQKYRYDKLVESMGDDFTEDTMFVAASDICLDKMPSDTEAKKKWKPTIKCRVFLTCMTMCMFVPAISTGLNVLERITANADATYNIFTVDDFKCIEYFIYDAAGNAKIAGYQLTCHENGGCYYLSARAHRAFTEYFCSLPKHKLPGRVQSLPFHMPSPVPPSTKCHPLKYDVETEKFHQPWTGQFYVASPSRRYKHRSSAKSRDHLTQNAEFYVDFQDLPPGTEVKTFRCDVDGLDWASMSDGDKAIPNGIQAAHPCMSEAHSDCSTHMDRHNNGTVMGLEHKDMTPQFDWDGRDDLPAEEDEEDDELEGVEEEGEEAREEARKEEQEEQERPVYYKDRKKMFYRVVKSNLLCVQRCRCRLLSNKIFEDLIRRLRQNQIYYSKANEYNLRYPGLDFDKYALDISAEADEGIHIPGSYSKYADYLAATYNRPTTNGSWGFWRMSDLCESSMTAVDSDGRVTNDRNDPLNLFFGIPFHANSAEGMHHSTKTDLAEKECGGPGRGTVVAKMNGLREVGQEYARNERTDAGVSTTAPVFGQGSHGRVKSDRHNEARRIGMLFSGQNGNQNEWNCQLPLFSKSRKKGSGLNTILYIVHSEENLHDLKVAIESLVKEGSLDPNDERAVRKARENILKGWFQKYSQVVKVDSNKLDAMINDLAEDIYREKMGIEDDEPLPEELDRDPALWSKAVTESIMDWYGYEQTFAAVTPVDIDVEGAKALEPFRINLGGNEAEIVYLWRCNCYHALDNGICEHIILVQHSKWELLFNDPELEGYTGVDVPPSMINYDLRYTKPRGNSSRRSTKARK